MMYHRLKHFGRNVKKIEVIWHGELSIIADDDQDAAACEGTSLFPLLAIRSQNWLKDKSNVLITGGVHGYETSGIMGVIQNI
eukprot:11050110-Ditylum_brightwellii.AAC.1